MNNIERQAHWEKVYQTKGEHEVSWFQEGPAISLELIRATGVNAKASIIDIGGGASRLVDALLDQGYSAVTVLDLSERALETSKARLGSQSAAKVKWVAVDVTAWEPSQAYDVWHDRATFHFLTDRKDRAAYVERVLRAVSLRWPRDYRDIRRWTVRNGAAACPLSVTTQRRSAKYSDLRLVCRRAGRTLIKRRWERFSASSSIAFDD